MSPAAGDSDQLPGRWLREQLRAGIFFAAAAVALTWPLAASPGAAVSVRDDYYSNMWNSWWVGKALFELHVSPYWTDYLFYPSGISLGRHTLSPLNAVTGALASLLLSPATAYNLLLCVHFWLSAWAAFALARYATGSGLGSVLAGLVYAFCPVHYFYLPQINVATFEFLPLAFLFLLKTHREGGGRNAAGAAASAGLLAASSLYYLVYAFLFAALLLACGRLWVRGKPLLPGARRLLGAGLVAAVIVAAVAWPLLTQVLDAWSGGWEGAANVSRRPLGNDLLGFNWTGAPSLTVSWPTMLGYAALLLVAAGWRGVREQKGWLAVGGVFLVLGLGSTLRVGGVETDVSMPYALLARVPVLGMLRMSNRFFVVVQLVFAVLCAAAWKDLASRLPTPRLRNGCGIALAALIALELTGVPFRTFSDACSPYLSRLAQSPAEQTLVELPVYPASSFYNGRYDFCQTFHEKKIPQGYVTALAVPRAAVRESVSWVRAYRALTRGSPQPLLDRVHRTGIDLVVLNKRVPQDAGMPSAPEGTLWRPFFFDRGRLVGARQRGHLRDRDLSPAELELQVRALSRVLGEPVFEDASIAVFRAGDPRRSRDEGS
jgi:hypothetical protein